MNAEEEPVDHGQVRRVVAALGLAYAEGDADRCVDLLKGINPQTAGAILLSLTGSWVTALDLVGEGKGVPDPRAYSKEILYSTALEAAAG